MWMAGPTCDLPSMRNDDLLRKRQPEASTPLLGGVEQIKHVLALFLSNASALVVDLNAYTTLVARRFELGGPPIRHCFTCVAQ